MSRRQFFQDVRRVGRPSTDSGADTPHRSSADRVTSTDDALTRERAVTGDDYKATAPDGGQNGVAVQDLCTPIRVLSGDRVSPDEPPHTAAPYHEHVHTDPRREGAGNGVSPTPTKQPPAASGDTHDSTRSRSNTAPFPHDGTTAREGSQALAASTPGTSPGSRERSGSTSGVPSAFPVAAALSAGREGQICRSPPVGISPRHTDSISSASRSGDRSLSRPSSGGVPSAVTSVPTVVFSNMRDASKHQQLHDHKCNTATPRNHGTDADDTPFQSGLDTPDHRSSRAAFRHHSRSPAGTSPTPASAEIRLTLDDPVSDRRSTSSPSQPLTSTGVTQRERDGSFSRIEGTLVAMQVELANEKRNNIEAELTISSLRREIAVLKAENQSLAAAAATARSVGESTLARPMEFGTSTSGSTSSRYVEELEARVARLNSALESKHRELEAKDERVRLLEHKLADQLLMGSTVPPLAPQALLPFSGQGLPAVAPHANGQPLRGEVRPIASSSTAPAVSHRGGAAPPVTTNTSDLQPVSTDGGHTAMEKKVRARSSSALRGASPAAAAPADKPVSSHSPQKRHATASARRPSVRRGTWATVQPASDIPAQPRTRSTAKRDSVSRPRAGSVTTADRFTRRSSNQPAPAAPVVRKQSTSTMLNSSIGSLPRRMPSPKRENIDVPNSSARRLSSASAGRHTAGSQRPQQPRRPSATRRDSGQQTGGHAFDLSPAPPSLASGPTTTITTSGYANSSLYRQPAALRSMMGAQAGQPRTSPARSATASLRSGTSTRSRPRITYDERGDLTSMQGTTTTVTFRSNSTSHRPVSVPPGYAGEYARMRPDPRDAPLVPGNGAPSEGREDLGNVTGTVGGCEGSPAVEVL